MPSFSKTASLSFIWRRVHSLMGLWLVGYLGLHLTINSQAPLWLGTDGHGFIHFVNFLESLPYLHVIEWTLIGIPLIVHGIWGVKRALDAKVNLHSSDLRNPSLGYARNYAFTWQRLSSWILLLGILGHVVQMRFVYAPKKVFFDQKEHFLTAVRVDDALYPLADRLQVALLSSEQIEDFHRQEMSPKGFAYLEGEEKDFVQEQRFQEKQRAMEKMRAFRIGSGEVLAVTKSPGTAMLLMVRETFKSPIMVILYTIFVLAAAFHAVNGFWTALITWGMILSYRSQKAFLPMVWVGVALLSFLGLAAIWGSYWVQF